LSVNTAVLDLTNLWSVTDYDVVLHNGAAGQGAESVTEG
jgi:hypothetical protein